MCLRFFRTCEFCFSWNSLVFLLLNWCFSFEWLAFGCFCLCCSYSFILSYLLLLTLLLLGIGFYFVCISQMLSFARVGCSFELFCCFGFYFLVVMVLQQYQLFQHFCVGVCSYLLLLSEFSPKWILYVQHHLAKYSCSYPDNNFYLIFGEQNLLLLFWPKFRFKSQLIYVA